MGDAQERLPSLLDEITRLNHLSKSGLYRYPKPYNRISNAATAYLNQSTLMNCRKISMINPPE